MTSEDDEEYDLRTLRHLQGDLKHTHAEILKTFNSISQKSGRLIQFNGTILSLLAGAAALVDSNILKFVHGLSVAGFVLIIISIVILLRVHQTETVVVGTGEKERKIAIGDSYDHPPLNEVSYLLWINDQYTDWISQAATKNKKNGELLYIAEIYTVLGVLSILVGTLISVV